MCGDGAVGGDRSDLVVGGLPGHGLVQRVGRQDVGGELVGLGHGDVEFAVLHMFTLDGDGFDQWVHDDLHGRALTARAGGDRRVARLVRGDGAVGGDRSDLVIGGLPGHLTIGGIGWGYGCAQFRRREC